MTPSPLMENCIRAGRSDNHICYTSVSSQIRFLIWGERATFHVSKLINSPARRTTTRGNTLLLSVSVSKCWPVGIIVDQSLLQVQPQHGFYTRQMVCHKLNGNLVSIEQNWLTGYTSCKCRGHIQDYSREERVGECLLVPCGWLIPKLLHFEN